jgi:hypothetical protein
VKAASNARVDDGRSVGYVEARRRRRTGAQFTNGRCSMGTWGRTALMIAVLVFADAAIGASDVDLVKGRTWLCHGVETFSLRSFGSQKGSVYTEEDPIVLMFNDDPDSEGNRSFNFSNRSQGLIFGTWNEVKRGKIVLTLDQGFVDAAYVPYIRTVITDILAKSKAVKRVNGTVSPTDVTAPSTGFTQKITLNVSDSLRLRAKISNALTYSATIRDAEGNVLRRVKNAKMLERGTYRGTAPQ